ncbi:MAG TPA: C13 family peptidase [Caulobacteraceae bacterium]|nr:C13 family peptidase [Caulobacteraceae bacterium]
MGRASASPFRIIAATVLAIIACLAGADGALAEESPFAHWAAVVISGDYHAHSGAISPAFDNARRDVSEALLKLGFRRDHIAQFSSLPDGLPDGVKPARIDIISTELQRVAALAPEGCLVYFTSHGQPGLVMMSDQPLMASGLASIVDSGCPASRPAVLIISACFSGSLIPTLSGPNRMILTAARPDRSSFGCSESDKYPYFDACILQTLPTVDNFVALAAAARACVAEKEKAADMSPPSEPQVAVGAGLAPTLPFYGFRQH